MLFLTEQNYNVFSGLYFLSFIKDFSKEFNHNFNVCSPFMDKILVAFYYIKCCIVPLGTKYVIDF